MPQNVRQVTVKMPPLPANNNSASYNSRNNGSDADGPGNAQEVELEVYPVANGVDSEAVGPDGEYLFDPDLTRFSHAFSLPGVYRIQSDACRASPMAVVVLPPASIEIDVVAGRVNNDGKKQVRPFSKRFVVVPRGGSVQWRWDPADDVHGISEIVGDDLMPVGSGVGGTRDDDGSRSTTAMLMFNDVGTRVFTLSPQRQSGNGGGGGGGGGALALEHTCTVCVQFSPISHSIKFGPTGVPTPEFLQVYTGDTVNYDWTEYADPEHLNPDLREIEVEAAGVFSSVTAGLNSADEEFPIDVRSIVHTYGADAQGGYAYAVGSAKASAVLMVLQTSKSHTVTVPGLHAPTSNDAAAAGEGSGSGRGGEGEVSPLQMSPSYLELRRGESCEWLWSQTPGDTDPGSEDVLPVRLMVSPLAPFKNILGPTPVGEPDVAGSEAWFVEQWHMFPQVGIYECRLSNKPDTIIGTVCVKDGPVDILVEVFDDGFEPEMVYPRPSDRIWWRWQGCSRNHWIQQISFERKPISSTSLGRKSLLGKVGLHMEVLGNSGVYYFMSNGHTESQCSAVLALPKADTRVISLLDGSRWKDDGNQPILARRDDCLVFANSNDHCTSSRRSTDDEAAKAEEERLGYVDNPEPVSVIRSHPDGTAYGAAEVDELGLEATSFVVSPTVPINIQLTNTGQFHFVAHDAIRTVIVDERAPAPHQIVLAENGTFSPRLVHVKPNSTVCWTWSGEYNSQRIFASDEDGAVLSYGYDSGDAAIDAQHAQTFSDPGIYHTSSGKSLSIVVVTNDIPLVGAIELSSPSYGRLDSTARPSLGDELVLGCNTQGATIYYTLDGTEPRTYDSLIYTPGETVITLESMSPFIRALAFKEGCAPAHFISHRLVTPGFREILLGSALLIQRWFRKFKERKAAAALEFDSHARAELEELDRGGAATAADVPPAASTAIDSTKADVVVANESQPNDDGVVVAVSSPASLETAKQVATSQPPAPSTSRDSSSAESSRATAASVAAAETTVAVADRAMATPAWTPDRQAQIAATNSAIAATIRSVVEAEVGSVEAKVDAANTEMTATIAAVNNAVTDKLSEILGVLAGMSTQGPPGSGARVGTETAAAVSLMAAELSPSSLLPGGALVPDAIQARKSSFKIRPKSAKKKNIEKSKKRFRTRSSPEKVHLSNVQVPATSNSATKRSVAESESAGRALSSGNGVALPMAADEHAGIPFPFSGMLDGLTMEPVVPPSLSSPSPPPLPSVPLPQEFSNSSTSVAEEMVEPNLELTKLVVAPATVPAIAASGVPGIVADIAAQSATKRASFTMASLQTPSNPDVDAGADEADAATQEAVLVQAKADAMATEKNVSKDAVVAVENERQQGVPRVLKSQGSAFFEVFLQYPSVEQRDRCERAISGLIAERHQQQIQVQASIARAKRLSWTEIARDPTLNKISERMASNGASLLEQFDLLEDIDAPEQPVRVVWDLDDTTASQLDRIEVQCRSFLQTLPASARQCVITTASGSSSDVDVRLFFAGGATLAGSAEANIPSATTQLHYVCSPRLCATKCRPYPELLASFARKHEKARGKGMRAARLPRSMRQGKAFPLDESLFQMRWVDSPVTLIMFVMPHCTPSRAALVHLRDIMKSASGSPHKLIRDSRCVVVSCGSEDETQSVLHEIECGSIHNCTVIPWDRDFYVARLKEAHVSLVPSITVVGMTGNVHWSGTQPLHDGASYIRSFLHRMHRVVGCAAGDTPIHSPTRALSSHAPEQPSL